MRRSLSGPWTKGAATVALLGLLAVASCAQDGDVPATPPAGTTTADQSPGPSADDRDAITWQPPVRVSVDFGFSRPEFAAGAGVLVAVAKTSTEEPAATRVHTSADGVSWDNAATLDGVRLGAVIPEGAGFVAVGDSDTAAGRSEPVVATSTDGTTWDLNELETANGGRLTDVAVTATGVVAVGARTDKRGTARPAVWTSADGRSWKASPQDQFAGVDATLVVVAAAGSTVITLGYVPTEADSPGPLLGWRSSDGLRWERSKTPEDWTSVLVGDLTAGSAGAVLVGTPFEASASPQAWNTEDGRRWTSASLPTLPSTDSSFAIEVASVEGRYVVVGDDVDFAEDLGPATGRPAVWTSDDAMSWVRVPMTELEGPALAAGSDALAVLFQDGRWLVYGTTSSRVDAPVNWVLWVGE